MTRVTTANDADTPALRADTPAVRKARGAFFTPLAITRFLAEWAIRAPEDRVLEPSAGDAAFLVSAVNRLRTLSEVAGGALTGGQGTGTDSGAHVHGVEIHESSARIGAARVRAAGGVPHITVSDFFLIEPDPVYDAVIGNPPYIRYQDFSGESRARARQAALRAGVPLTGLASSWAAFTVHAALFLREGGRLGLVLPAELLSVNYAAPVRQFLFESFRDVQLVLFDKQVFPEAEADVVLLLADGYRQGPTSHATIRQSPSAAGLASLAAGTAWTPVDPAAKWTSGLLGSSALDLMTALVTTGEFVGLETWGDTTLGMVTGNNRYFAFSPERVRALGLHRNEVLRLSPPGSAHLRGLALSHAMLARLGRAGKSTFLFYPAANPSPEAEAYIRDGQRTGVDTAYKCRMRKTWYRVPLVPPADLLLTCMNADTPRLTTNSAGARHLNSVHGVYLADDLRKVGRELLPLASLNSVTLLSAEMVGRAYGGGILKLEPKEADVWSVPSPHLVEQRSEHLRAVKPEVARLLRSGRLQDAVQRVDQALFGGALRREEPSGGFSERVSRQLPAVREAREALAGRRAARGASGGR